MKNIFLGLALILSLQSIGQGKFRGMDWGTTSSELKSNYPDAKWESHIDGKVKAFMTEDYVGGLKVNVVYYFIDDKLKWGMYSFSENHKSDNMYYDDFMSISIALNKKYDMEMSKEWNNTTWEDKPNYIGYALVLGHVEITEIYADGFTAITHTISSDNNSDIEHSITYYDVAFVKEMSASELEDF